MGKIIGKLKHNHNAFPQIQTKFFREQYKIWSFAPSFNKFQEILHFTVPYSVL